MSAFTNLLYHVVASYLGGILRNHRCVLLEIAGVPDHVHLIVKWRADLSVSDLLRLIGAVGQRAGELLKVGERTSVPSSL